MKFIVFFTLLAVALAMPYPDEDDLNFYIHSPLVYAEPVFKSPVAPQPYFQTVHAVSAVPADKAVITRPEPIAKAYSPAEVEVEPIPYYADTGVDYRRPFIYKQNIYYD